MGAAILTPEEAKKVSNASLIHLRLLFAFRKLRVQVGSQNGLWGIWDDRLDRHPLLSKNEREQGLAKIKEKRWSIYLARAIYRYHAWWESLKPKPLTETETESMHSARYAKFPMQSLPTSFTQENMIPLDVLMVWHTHMLNPRLYLEDTMRQGRGDIWSSGMPWDIVSGCLASDDFEYDATEASKSNWKNATGLSWNNMSDLSHVDVVCPSCISQMRFPWTTCVEAPIAISTEVTAVASSSKIGAQQGNDASLQERLNLIGHGLADAQSLHNCESCGVQVDKDLLCFGKFIKDAENHATSGYCMPATVLDPRTGMPELDDPDPKPKPKDGVVRKANSALTSPNRLTRRVLLHKARTELRLLRDDDGKGPRPSMDSLRRLTNSQLHECYTLTIMAGDDAGSYSRSRELATKLQDQLENQANYEPESDATFNLLTLKTRVVVRRMLAQYTDNWSPFALDLRSAMLRQSLFIDKMYMFDWLHCPDPSATMTRAVTKYARFLQLAKDNPKQMVVPTLDVDLAWHTHQLSPRAYYRTTTRHLHKFLDHDDKVDEKKLSESFDWMSEAYYKKYKEIYSECLCWYCQVTRASRTSSLSIFIGESKRQKAFKDLWVQQTSSSSPPDDGPHLSAHNAVRVPSVNEPLDKKARKSYDKHMQRRSSGVTRAGELVKKLEGGSSAKRQQPPAPQKQKQEQIDHWGYAHPHGGPWTCPAFFDQLMYTSSISTPPPGSGINVDGNIGGCATGCGSLSRCGAATYTLEGTTSDVHSVPKDNSSSCGGGGCGGCGG